MHCINQRRPTPYQNRTMQGQRSAAAISSCLVLELFDQDCQIMAQQCIACTSLPARFAPIFARPDLIQGHQVRRSDLCMHAHLLPQLGSSRLPLTSRVRRPLHRPLRAASASTAKPMASKTVITIGEALYGRSTLLCAVVGSAPRVVARVVCWCPPGNPLCVFPQTCSPNNMASARRKSPRGAWGVRS